MEDRMIIKLFFNRSETAITETNNKYGKFCHNLSYNILHDHRDAEECVNDSYLGLWNSIPPNNPDPFITYLCKIVRNLSIKRYQKNTAQKRNSFYDTAIDELEEYLISDDILENQINSNELTAVIENFLDTLSAENRILFLKRYWFYESYDIIAKQFGITEKNLSVRLTRIRKKMRKYLIERGVLI